MKAVERLKKLDEKHGKMMGNKVLKKAKGDKY